MFIQSSLPGLYGVFIINSIHWPPDSQLFVTNSKQKTRHSDAGRMLDMEIKSHDRAADGKLHYTENFPLVQPQRCSSHG